MATPPDRPTSNAWDSDAYDGSHSFVYEYGEAVVDLLDPVTDERVLDLGCGTGHLTNAIAERGADVVGLDRSVEMLAEARGTFPELDFVRGDAQGFSFAEPFDAVFSNAVLHWVQDQDAVLDAVGEALRPGGQFVAEFGGSGNVRAIVDAVDAELDARGYDYTNPWYFPTVGEYATRLESHGFEVRYATLFDRPVDLDDGADGLANWLGMFGDDLFAHVPDSEHEAVLRGVEDRLRDHLHHDGVWTADYRRIRVRAVRTAPGN